MFTLTLACAFFAVRGDDGAAKLSLAQLSQEVSALHTLYSLQVTAKQLTALRKLAVDTSFKSKVVDDMGTNAELRQVLAALHRELLAEKDAEKIDELTQQLWDLRDANDADLSEEFELTESAIEKTPEALRLLSAAQVAEFGAIHAADLADPRELLQTALDKVRGLPPVEWNEFREFVSGEVGRLLGGLDEGQTLRATDAVVQWLIVIRSLGDADFKGQHKALEEQINEIIGNTGPTDILKNYLEQSMADLLSNPRILPSIDLRLKRLNTEAEKAEAKPVSRSR